MTGLSRGEVHSGALLFPDRTAGTSHNEIAILGPAYERDEPSAEPVAILQALITQEQLEFLGG